MVRNKCSRTFTDFSSCLVLEFLSYLFPPSRLSISISHREILPNCVRTNSMINENGIPCRPHDSSLPMKLEGRKSHSKNNHPTMKFACIKMKRDCTRVGKSKRQEHHCYNPYTTSSCCRMIYVYPEEKLRSSPSVERCTEE